MRFVIMGFYVVLRLFRALSNSPRLIIYGVEVFGLSRAGPEHVVLEDPVGQHDLL